MNRGDVWLNRSEILKRLKYNFEHNIPIVGCGAGTGLSAIAEVAGGAYILRHAYNYHQVASVSGSILSADTTPALKN